MRRLVLPLFLLAIRLHGACQAADPALPQTPKDPEAILAAAAPFYNFSEPSLHPWHLKATYQLYDSDGKPTEQGTFEYWWASPQVYRISWSRPSATHTDWYTADGKQTYTASGQPIGLFENTLYSELVSPMPGPDELDPTRYRLDRQTLKLGQEKLPCVQVIPIMPRYGPDRIVPLGWFPSYCFDAKMPALRVGFSLGKLTTTYNRIIRVQDRLLARQIEVTEGKRNVLSATVEEIGGISESDHALIPDADAIAVSNPIRMIDPKVMEGLVLKRAEPVYPEDALEAHVSGTVTLQLVIGADGEIRDLRVLTAPWPSLAASAIWAASQWQCKPYTLNGRPVAVVSTVKVIYTLGQ